MTGEALEFSYRNRLSHLSSTLSAYPIIASIYERILPDERFVLSQGHAAAALYLVLGDAQRLLEKHGIHPHRDVEDGIWCSTGSLGMGITVALGMAMAGRTVHVLISDGECAEGSVWEALRLAREFCEGRLRVYVNFNGMSALGGVSFDLAARLIAFLPSVQICYSSPVNLPFTRGLEAHYHVITDAEWGDYMVTRKLPAYQNYCPSTKVFDEENKFVGWMFGVHIPPSLDARTECETCGLIFDAS